MKRIDMEQWPRRGHYNFFAPMSDPFYTLSFPVDVTALRTYCKAEGLSFYHALVYGVTKAMEAVEAFHYKDRQGEIIYHERLVPSFTHLEPGGELFRIITLDAGNDLADFCRRAGAQAAAQRDFITQGPRDGDALIYFTCLPWFPLTSLTNEKDLKPWDSVPRAAWGRWEEQKDKTMLNLSLELNHRLLDGVHVGRFYQRLCQWMEEL